MQNNLLLWLGIQQAITTYRNEVLKEILSGKNHDANKKVILVEWLITNGFAEGLKKFSIILFIKLDEYIFLQALA